MANEEEGNNNNNNSLKIIVERNPSQAKLSQLNIHRWPKWGCSAGKYQLKFEAEETCYLVKGKVKAYPKGIDSSSSSSSSCCEEYIEFGAGDLVIIPKGLSCTWDVSVAVDKFYKFESQS
ncbi:uncharacterized protein LOC101208389 [Cucumis sativus]|uniref:uncharacterized protein LOC101208389 n=1 Tax=Cucumis sativus TaxID=3659 RepID=UPI0002B44093|nr:uncharacterized protein LOC101208389 [Cucumis sativus]KAE8646737.1 hypothetical protein Csa_005490 [Cucumis sativus]